MTVTTPLVDACPELLTTTLYTTPVCPAKKLPVWVLAIVKSGDATITRAG